MTRRGIIVSLLCVLSISLWAPDLRRAFGHPVGIVARDAAGQQTIDLRRIALRATDLQTRLHLLRNGDCWTVVPGIICRYGYRDGTGVRTYVQHSHAESPINGKFVLMRTALALLFLFVGAVMLLLRPGPATWAFFILSLYGWSPNNIYNLVGPAWLQAIAIAFENAFEACIPYAGVVFALYLLQPYPLRGWRRRALFATYAFATLCAALQVSLVLLVVNARGDALLSYATRSFVYLGILGTAIPPFLLLATYLESAHATRERVRWVLIGTSLAALASISTILTAGISYAAYSSSQAVYTVAITATTAYAVLRHRIIDVNVVVSRAVVYGALSAFVVGLFALVDLFFTRALSQNNAGLMADVVLALVLGFFMNSLHKNVDRIVDGVLFRKRHLAEQHLATVARALQHATTIQRVDEMLIDEPVYSFVLSFGVLARCAADGGLQTIHSAGAEVPLGLSLANADALIAYLQAERKALRLRDHGWRALNVCVDGVEPTIAVPIFSHAELIAVAFYAPHKNQTEIDGDEIGLVENVAFAAGAAYDRLEARALRDEVARLRSRDPLPA